MIEIESDLPLKIGVLSDTHLRKPSKALFDLREGLFSDLDIILHAGDITNPEVLDIFYDYRLYAVAGNCDGPSIRAIYPDSMLISIGGVKIALIHGHNWGEPSSISKRLKAHLNSELNAIVFGHTHIPAAFYSEEVYMFNPGSFSYNRKGPWPSSVGILTISSEGVICGDIFPVS